MFTIRGGLAGVALAALMIAPCQAQAPTVLPADVAAKIDAGFEKWAKDQPVPGLVWGVVAGGRLAHAGSYGVQTVEGGAPVTPDTLFRIASMTKAFTALSVLKLRDDGKLQLDAPVSRYAPELRHWRPATDDSPAVTVRDLLSHVGGFVTDDPWGDRQQVLSQAAFTKMLAAGVPFSRAPGTEMEYSNFGYALLGRVIANVSGMPYRRYVERTLLTPLGMTSSGYDAPQAPPARYAIGYRWDDGRWRREPEMQDGAFNSMGGLQVSASDYARWVAFLLSAWPARDGPDAGPVRRSTVRELAEWLNFVRIAQRRTAKEPCPQTNAYGKGMQVIQDCQLGLTLGHGGGYPGYGSFVLLLPDFGVGLFALSNRTYAGPRGAVWDAAVALDEGGVLHLPAKVPSPILLQTQDAVRRAYAAGNLDPLDGRLAMNFLMDRDRDAWDRDLVALKSELGDCPTTEPMFPGGALSSAFRWNCAKGKLDGYVLLAPTNPPTIQSLRLKVTKP